MLAGAIDYYIVAKLQNLRNDAVYVKVFFSSLAGPCVVPLMAFHCDFALIASLFTRGSKGL